MTFTKTTLGYSIQIIGASCVLIGTVLSVHHAAIAACLGIGAVGLYIGRRIRAGA